jgi:hypothetical protein
LLLLLALLVSAAVVLRWCILQAVEADVLQETLAMSGVQGRLQVQQGAVLCWQRAADYTTAGWVLVVTGCCCCNCCCCCCVLACRMGAVAVVVEACLLQRVDLVQQPPLVLLLVLLWVLLVVVEGQSHLLHQGADTAVLPPPPTAEVCYGRQMDMVVLLTVYVNRKAACQYAWVSITSILQHLHEQVMFSRLVDLRYCSKCCRLK